jgi:hypothetical protein
MSREIDLDKPLSADDRQYLLDRWDTTRLRRNMENLGVDPSVAFRAQNMSHEEYESHISKASGGDTSTPTEQPPAVPGGSADPQPASTSGVQAARAEGASGNEVPVRSFADESLAEKSYDEWTNEQLRAEITKRNEMRVDDPDYEGEDPMVTTGNKGELVARLREDDEADAPE